MRKLKYPAIYKHFKNKFYATIGISTYINIDIFKEMLKKDDLTIFNLPNVSVEHTESGDNIVSVNYKERWYHFDVCQKDLVLYKSLYDNKGIYGRPLDMFLSEVDKDKYPDVLQKYRFEEYKD